MRRLLILASLIAVACQRPTASRLDDVEGHWQKIEESLPPVDLTLTRAGTDLKARLRLSGIESFGTATLDGTHLRIVFDGQSGELNGEFISKVELTLKLGSPPIEQRLRKQN